MYEGISTWSLLLSAEGGIHTARFILIKICCMRCSTGMFIAAIRESLICPVGLKPLCCWYVFIADTSESEKTFVVSVPAYSLVSCKRFLIATTAGDFEPFLRLVAF